MYGPLHNENAVEIYKSAVDQAVKNGGKIEVGGNVSLSIFFKKIYDFLSTAYF